jgi:2'-5' RNA ligase
VSVAPVRDIGVAIGIPEPFGGELQGWRERLGDPNASRIVPHVTLLPPTPVSPEALPEIEEHLRVEAKVRSGPLWREIGYAYHPHVTVAHDLPDDALYRAWTALSAYDASFQVFGFTLFEQGPDLVWRPQRDFTFGGGGLPGPPEEPFARQYEGW